MRVEVRIKSITCLEARDAGGSAEPYLWPFFFRVDAATVLRSRSHAVLTYDLLSDLPPKEVLRRCS